MAGLPPTSVGPFIEAFLGGEQAALAQIPDVTPAVLSSAGAAYKHAFADSARVVFIIAAPFAFLGCVLSLLLPSFRGTMDYVVDAPLEDLHKRHKHEREGATNMAP